MDKREKMNQIKEYISRIEEDLNTSVRSDRETITNKNILQCMKYISELLEETINESSSKISQSGKRFFITEEQRLQLQIIPNAMVSEIANELNRVTAENNVKKIQATWITNWLISVGFLEINTSGKRTSTNGGKSIEITSQLKNRLDGTEYYQNYYSEKAQEFIYDNIDSIISFHYNSKQKSSKVKSQKSFFITEEQRSQLKINGIKIIKDIVNELNRVTLYNNTEKIENEWIANWLIDVGMLKRDSNGYICVTQHGNEIGIISRLKIKRYNNLYSEDAQKFIYDNIDSIIAFHYGEN